jgi:hypothetical protein
MTLGGVYPDYAEGPVFELLAAAPITPAGSGLFLVTFTLQFTLPGADSQPQVSVALETGPDGVGVHGGSQDGTQGGLAYVKGSPVSMTGVTAGQLVANASNADAAGGVYSLTGSGVAKAPLGQTSALALVIADASADMTTMVLTMAIVELPE